MNSMLNYLGEDSPGLVRENILEGVNIQGLDTVKALPVKPSKSEWITQSDPQCLVRSYYFKTFDEAIFFINIIMKYQHKTNHHYIVNINHLNVTVKIGTFDMGIITELDIEHARFVDSVFEDVRSRNESDDVEVFGG